MVIETDIDDCDASGIVRRCNNLARTFYKMQGCEVPDDFKFYQAHHPAEVGCWNMAVAAYEQITFTDVDDCLAQAEDEA
jgi:hypothetical protein